MEYAKLAAFFERLEATSKRLEMTAILVELLDAAPRDEAKCIVRLMQGQVAPDWEGIELGLAEKLVLQGLARYVGRSLADATAAYHEAGDLGVAAQRLVEKGGTRQVGLMAFGGAATARLRVADVFARLASIAAATGAGSQERKQEILVTLLSEATPVEAKYIIRAVAGRLRLGVADMTFLDALAAWHVGKGVRSLQGMEADERSEQERVRALLERAYDLRSDLAVVADLLATEGLDAVANVKVEHGTPLRPMAAERLKSLPEILDKHAGRSALEYKYDGLRLQCHVRQGQVRLFSRRLEDLTAQFPDVQAALTASFTGASCIVEGECVAWDEANQRMRPFQDVSRRRGRKTGLGMPVRSESALGKGATAAPHDPAGGTTTGKATSGAATDAEAPAGPSTEPGAAAFSIIAEVPVKLFLFDCLAVHGVDVMHESFEARRARLPGLFATDRDVALSVMEIAADVADMEAFFARAVADGAEGIMCKDLRAPYKAGNRGFDWIKFKTDYTAELVDTMDLVVIGGFYGRGRRAGWYGALLMAAFDPESGHFASVCKLGTGFDDETLMGLKDRFIAHESPERPNNVESEMTPDVWLHPAVVMEVQAAELTLSPTHRAGWGRLKEGAGLAARFPRFSGRWRDDKDPQDATTVEELVRMYEEQSKKSA